MSRISDRFIKNCTLYPSNNAIFINEKHYTYSELLQLTNSVILNLKKENVTDEKIAVYCSDDIETYISILAISIYGSCYVPINAKNPSDYSQEIISNSDVKTILYSNKIELPKQLKKNKVIEVNSKLENNPINEKNLDRIIHQEYSYLLHTSGSTGRPKGVAISNQQINTFFNFFYLENQFHFSENDRFIQVFELTFDVSVFSFFMPLNIGACCYVVPQNSMKFLETIRIIKEHSITVSTFVPTLLNHIEKYLQELYLPTLKYSFFIGDKLIHSLTSKWSKAIPNAEIINFYGPTEATVMCSFYEWEDIKSENESENDIVPIGKLFPSLSFKIIDENDSIIQQNQLGELCLTGDQVIQHYNKETNKEAFIELFDNQVYYKTGDLVHLNQNGDLIFHSRKDRQVKINSHRIEINEIEAVLRKFLKNSFCVSTFQNSKKLDELVLFIEKDNLNKIEIDEIKKYLNNAVPNYMIPHVILSIENIPLNSNQKIDFKKLNEIYHLNKSI
jgi:amino acid adenylation domain-containing protein